MEDQQTQVFMTSDFNQDEFQEVMEKSQELIKRGYVTGINFLQAQSKLPRSAVLVHFLHDSEQHLQAIESQIYESHLTVPRYTCYMLRPEYFKKPNFKEEYANAIFFNQEFKTISIENAIGSPTGISVFNRELDFMIPVCNIENLESLVQRIKNADRNSPDPWIDPVIIIKTEQPITAIPEFVDKHYVSLARDKEEFYAILNDRMRANALEKYFGQLCQEPCTGNLRRSDIVFKPSQVNKEFADFLSSIQNELNALE